MIHRLPKMPLVGLLPCVQSHIDTIREDDQYKHFSERTAWITVDAFELEIPIKYFGGGSERKQLLRARAAAQLVDRDFSAILYEQEKIILMDVPENFCCDLASVPKWLRMLVSPSNPLLVFPSVVHDVWYSRSSRNLDKKTLKLARNAVDHLYYEMMLMSGYSSRRANWVYTGVRAFGGGSFGSEANMYLAPGDLGRLINVA